MYMFYMVSVIALSAGVGTFVTYDVAMQQRDVTALSRAEVAESQQAQISRALRREYMVNPASFPSPAPGTYARLSDSLLNGVADGGLILLENSEYYINDSGEILAVLTDGPTAPSSGNGDLNLGVHSRPQYLEDLIEFLYGKDYVRGPDGEARQEQDGSTSAVLQQGLGDTLTAQQLDALGEDAWKTIASLDLGVGVSTEEQSALPSAASATPSVENPRYEAIAARFGVSAD